MLYKRLRRAAQIFFLCFFGLMVNVSQASSLSFIPNSFSLSYGNGDPNNLNGVRGALQWAWEKIWFAQTNLQLTGYWDLSLAYWNTDGNSFGQYKSVTIVAIAPVFRLQTAESFNTIKPYLEASVGAALLSSNHLGDRDLGGQGQFQDMLGFGTLFGSTEQYDVSVHFLHYSNAGLSPPNMGITLALLTFSYHFD